jgi:hypothetical protein
MPTDIELRQMALDIIDMAYLRLLDEICEDVLNEDVLLGHANPRSVWHSQTWGAPLRQQQISQMLSRRTHPGAKVQAERLPSQ